MEDFVLKMFNDIDTAMELRMYRNEEEKRHDYDFLCSRGLEWLKIQMKNVEDLLDKQKGYVELLDGNIRYKVENLLAEQYHILTQFKVKYSLY